MKMTKEETLQAIGSAWNAYKSGDREKAIERIDDIMSLGDATTVYAWWLTETNPEYMMTSEEFLEFVSDYCKTLRFREKTLPEGGR